MAKEKDETSSESFAARIDKRAMLWHEIIGDAHFRGEAKMNVSSIISKLKNSLEMDASEMDASSSHEAFAAAIQDLDRLSASAANVYKSKPEMRDEIEAVVDTLKGDIEDFAKELGS